MYYKEEWINGKLFWKSSPNGEWIEFTKQQYAERCLKLEIELKNLRLGAVIKSVCDVCGSDDVIEAPHMGKNCNRCHPL